MTASLSDPSERPAAGNTGATEGSKSPVDEKEQKRVVGRRKRRRVLIFVKVFVFAMMSASLGLLVWWVATHPIKIRIGKSTRVLTVKPAKLDFGQAEAGRRLTEKVTIKNRTRDEVEIQFIEFTNDSFRLKEKVRGVKLPPRGQVELTVVYDPHRGGVNEGEMRVRLRGQSSPELVIDLRGEALLPRLALSPASLAFGEVKSPAGSRLPLKLRNLGTQPLKVTAVAVRGRGFALAKPFTPGTIAPNRACTIEVAFVPAKQGASAGLLMIASNDPNEPEMIVLLSGSYGTAAKKEREKAQAMALLGKAKEELNTAYAYLSYRSTNRLLMIQRHQMGKNALNKAWPKYERANQMLRAIDPAFEDTEFYRDDEGRLGRRRPGG